MTKTSGRAERRGARIPAGRQEQGRVGLVGASTHNAPIARTAVESGLTNVLMVQVNPILDVHFEGASDVHPLCSDRDVGLVGMKPYNGGAPLVLDGQPTGITPVRCLSCALSLPVSVALPGPRNVQELQAALDYLEATRQEKDYDGIADGILEVFEGHCVYCDHCLPCPEGIGIGSVLMLADWARAGISDELRKWYARHEAAASDCVACGVCIERCPFSVDVVAQMQRASELFGA